MKKILFVLSLLVSLGTYAQISEEEALQDLINVRQKSIEFYKSYPQQLADAARSLENPNVVYDPSYVRISYPNGDVAADHGVCTDVVIRAFRKAWGWDLQKTIYEFQKEQFPDRKLDRNIDHRRVRNLMEFFDIFFDTAQLYNTHENEYRKGNIIIWDLGGGQLHIGICVANDTIIHNICCGQVIEPMYMQDRVIRNYSFEPDFHRTIMNGFLRQLEELSK
jgi:uncharacterized protein YijF (DUF1287 family)